MKRTIALGLIFLLVITIIPSSTFSAFAQTQEKIPVILLCKNHDSEHHKGQIESEGGEVKTTYKIIHGFVAKLSLDAIVKLKNDPEIICIDPDVQVKRRLI